MCRRRLGGRRLGAVPAAAAAGPLQPLAEGRALVVGGVGGVEGRALLQLIPQTLVGRRLQ